MKNRILFTSLFITIITFKLFSQLGVTPTLATSNVPEASQYGVLYQLDLPTNGSFNNLAAITYSIDNSSQSLNYTRVAYLLQLDNKWVWVSMNKFNTTNAQLGLPFNNSGIVFQQTVSAMNVYSSANAGVTNTTGINGNIEIWPDCYGQGLGLAGIGGNSGTYDFNDDRNAGSNCYGSFQFHNYNSQQTIFAYNSFLNGNNDDLGIGNNTGNGHPDWTYMYNASTYSVKKLWILVNNGVYISSPPISNSAISACLNATLSALTVSAGVNSGTISSYQWYSNSLNSNTGGTLVATNTTSSTVNTYTPSTSNAGTLYYYCTVNGSNGSSAKSSVSGGITVNPSPTITVNNGVICAGQNFTINPNGANTYTIQGGSAVVSPTSNASFTVSGTSGAGCLSQVFATSNLTVNPNPTITVNNGTICVGQNFTINPSGANTYTIQGGNAVVSPPSNSSYTVIGTNSATGCRSQTFATSSLIVNANPIITVNSGAICAGQNFTINPNGANTYTIQGGNAVVSPAVNTSYTVAGTSTAGCVSQAFATSNLIVNANPIITVNNGAICAGQNFTINPNGANTYTIQGGSAVVSPTSNASFTVSGTSGAGCVSQAFATSNLTVNPNPTITVNNGTICVGQNFTINPNGANTYTIQGGNAVVSPPSNSSYTVIGTNSVTGCRSQAFATSSLLVNANPIITVNSGAICAGQNFTINPNGANTYTIQGGNAVVSPPSNAIFTVAGTSTAGCVSQAVATSSLIVNQNPTITVNNGAICAGQNFTINPNGANTYTIQGANAVVSPSVNTTYTVIGTNTITGCRSQSFATSNLTVNPNPTVSISGASGICTGQNASLTANGATTYTWSTGSNSASIITTPTANTTYTLTGSTPQGCSSFTTQLVTVQLSLSVSIAGPTTVCYGEPANISGLGGVTYTWNTGATSSTIAPTLTTTTTFSLIGASGTCSNTASTTISVTPNPTVTITGTNAICANGTSSLTVNGATTYTWSSGSTSASVVFSPSATSVYSVVGSYSTGCLNATTQTVTVYTLPVVSISGPSVVCLGDSISLVANGANTYVWNNNATTTTIVITPTTTSTYSAVGTDTNGCLGLSAIDSIFVNPVPILSIISTATAICVGDTVKFTAAGANSYAWNIGDNDSLIVVTPTITTTYSVVGTNGFGCTSTKTDSVKVNALPVLTISGTTGTICIGENITLTANGANTYTWSGGINTNSIAVSPSVSTTYSASGTSTDGCVGSNTLQVIVSQCTSINIIASKTEFKVYPNPNNGEFTIELTNINNSNITITNVLGQIIKTQKAELINQIDLNVFDKGIYFINVMENNQSVYRGSIIKQ
jgi:propanediol utilization protein